MDPFCREFTLAEIEHFVDPSDKSHPKFENVENVHVTMLPGSYQMSGKAALNITLKEAYDTVSTVYKCKLSHILIKVLKGRGVYKNKIKHCIL